MTASPLKAAIFFTRAEKVAAGMTPVFCRIFPAEDGIRAIGAGVRAALHDLDGKERRQRSQNFRAPPGGPGRLTGSPSRPCQRSA